MKMGKRESVVSKVRDRLFWLAVVSACMAAQQHSAEAAVPQGPDKQAYEKGHGAEEAAILALFEDLQYSKVLETATTLWPDQERMPDAVLYSVAECYIRTGQVQGAKQAFGQLLSRAPQNSRYQAGMAYTLIYAGEIEKGLSLYRQVLQGNSSLLNMAAEDAEALLAQGNISGGKSLFEMVLANSPDKGSYFKRYGALFKTYKIAVNEKAAQSEVSAPAAKIAALAEAKAAGEATTAVVPALEEKTVAKQTEEKAERIGTLAKEYLRNKKPEQAVRLLEEKSANLPPEHPLVSEYIKVLYETGQYQRAAVEGEKRWGKAEAIAPEALTLLADSYLQLKQPKQAAAIYEQLATKAAKPVAKQRLQAFQLLLSGKLTDGLGLYQQLLETAPSTGMAVAEDASRLIQSGQYVIGKILFESLLEKMPSPVYRLQYAQVLSEEKQYRAAYKQYEELSKDNELEGLSGMARMSNLLGENPASKKLYEQIKQKYGKSKGDAAFVSPAWMATPDSSSKQRGTATTGAGDTDEFAYEMAQIATVFLSAPIQHPETFKVDFAYAMSLVTAKALPYIQPEQKNAFTLEMAQMTSAVLNDSQLDMQKARRDFAQLTTRMIQRIEENKKASVTSAVEKKDPVEAQTLAAAVGPVSPVQMPGNIDVESYDQVMKELSQVGKGKPGAGKGFKINGELRYHYASNSGDGEWSDTSGIRAYLGFEGKLNANWEIAGTVEGQKDIKNYNNEIKLSNLYAQRKGEDSVLTIGKFGYLMAEGNIYDSGFTGVRYQFGNPVQYSISYGKTNNTQNTYVATMSYKDFDYDVQAGLYRFRTEDTDQQNTLFSLGGNYYFDNMSFGAMLLRSNLNQETGYVFTLNYGKLRSYRPGTYNVFLKYYNQPRNTYIAHGMNGRADALNGFSGFGTGINYAVAEDTVAGLEYYDLKDQTTNRKSRTLWAQITRYF